MWKTSERELVVTRIVCGRRWCLCVEHRDEREKKRERESYMLSDESEDGVEREQMSTRSFVRREDGRMSVHMCATLCVCYTY